ncbi:hypothetical protein FACS1894206_03020 [Deltaproteobacteria bacterium]|nr:hypothetical protein FACS1894206_03020 [Deltaproteobacteria bacterium]
MKRLILFFCAFLSAGLLGCAHEGTDITRFGLADEVICADLGVFPQDLNVYAERSGDKLPLLTPERQDKEDTRFNRRFFAAWDEQMKRLPEKEVFEALSSLDPAKGYAENLRPYSQQRWQEIIQNCFVENFGKFPLKRAITVETAHLRRLPTDFPFFDNPGWAGEGFPFDYLQNSTLWAGTPVAVIHVSRDKKWVFAQTSLAAGWVRESSLAVADKAFIDAWRKAPLGVIIRDNVNIVVAQESPNAVTAGNASITAHTGTILPLASAAGRQPAQVPVFCAAPQCKRHGGEPQSARADVCHPQKTFALDSGPHCRNRQCHDGAALWLGRPFGQPRLFLADG